MNNKEIFIEKLNACGEIKYDVSQINNRNIAKIKTLYSIAFKTDKKNFSALHNMKYSSANLKLDEEKSKLLTMLDNFIKLVNHYDFISDNAITGYLADNGIQVSLITSTLKDETIDLENLDKKERKEFEQAWQFAMPGQDIPSTKKELLNMLLERSLAVQKDSCDKQEKIETEAKAVEDSCEVKKSLFMKALNIKYKELQKRSVDNELVKVEEEMEKTQDIVEIFKERIEVENQKTQTVIEKDKD
jgi:hypothetical protein